MSSVLASPALVDRGPNRIIYATIASTVDIRVFVNQQDRSLFEQWFDGLTADAARRVMTALYRLGLGNFSNVKGVGRGVFECRIDFGPGYRVYFGKDGDTIVILLRGGTKKRQQDDIAAAIELWDDYKEQKRSKPWR